MKYEFHRDGGKFLALGRDGALEKAKRVGKLLVCLNHLLFVRMILVLCCTASLVYSQGTGTLHGVVTDPSGLPIVKASVTASLTGRGLVRTIDTNERGEFVFPVSPVGDWAIAVEAQGFKQSRRPGITVTANENVRIDVKLEIGAVAEHIAVTAESPMVDSRSSVVGALVDQRRVIELPTNGRNVVALASMLPGVSQVNAPQTFTGHSDGPTVVVGGSRPNQNLFLLDGAHSNVPFRNTGMNYPPPDALQEVKVLTSTFSAEYGRNGGAIFNVVTKAGTNQLHGSAWEFWRNDNLNARNFFAPSQKPHLNQNQFGGSLGGPIRKDRLFLFGSYEGLLIRPQALSTSAFPLTDAERRGAFSPSGPAVRDPLTGQAFPNNQIPAARIDAVAGTLISRNLMPLPNRPDGQFVELAPAPQNNNQFLVRADYNRGRHTIDGHYNHNLATATLSVGHSSQYLRANKRNRSQNISIGDTFIVRPNLLNQFRASFNRMFINDAAIDPFTLADLGGNFPLLGPKQPPILTLSGRITLGNAVPATAFPVSPRIAGESLQVQDNISWTTGSHSVKAGVEFFHTRYINYSIGNTMGSFTFNGQVTGNTAADFLIGRPSSLLVNSPYVPIGGVQNSTYAFVQDDWKVHRRLTLNLGLRYELPLPWYSPDNFWGTLIPGRQSQVIPTAPRGLLYVGDPGVPRGLIQTDKNNWAPRFGFAFDPFGRGRTSVRGAYGIFYEMINADIILTDGQPFQYTYTISAPFSLADPLRGQPAIPTTVNLKDPQFVGLQQITYPDPGIRTGYVQQFNLNVQHEIARNIVVQLGYSGKVGKKLMISQYANPAVYTPSATLANINQRRILQGFGNNRVVASGASSTYHAFQAELNKRFSHGFSVQAAYTFSRFLDNKSSITANLGSAAPDPMNLRAEWALSDYNVKHVASGSWIWDIPSPMKSNRIVNAILGGWQMNGLVTLRSGLPFNVLSGRDVALSGTATQRPDVVGNPVLSDARPRQERILSWFDRAAFAFPAAGTHGNTGRNALVGPAAANTNLGLFKNVALPGREGLRLQFRTEYFNMFNSVNLANPATTLTAGAQMGRITSAADARVIQLALKVIF